MSSKNEAPTNGGRGEALPDDNVTAEELAAATRVIGKLLARLAAPPPAHATPVIYFTAAKDIRERTGHSARSLCEAACRGDLEATKAGRGWKFSADALARWEAARVDGRGRRTRTPKSAAQPANDAIEASRARLAAVGGVARRAG